MMRRITAAVAALFAVVATFAVLAFTQHPAPRPAGATVVMARSATGSLVPVQVGAAHATTSSSGVAGTSFQAATPGTTPAVYYVKTAQGRFVPVSAAPAHSPAPAAVTRSS